MKTPMITRTFTTTYATVLCLDTESCEPRNETVTLAGHYPDEDKILKECKKAIETETLAVVKVVSVLEKGELRGMRLQQFLELSSILVKGNPDEA